MKKNNIYHYFENSVEQLPMKISIITTVLSVVAFVIATFFYSEFMAKADGADLIGFPWHFYHYPAGGISYFTQATLSWILVLSLFVYILNHLFGKWRNRKRAVSPTAN